MAREVKILARAALSSPRRRTTAVSPIRTTAPAALLAVRAHDGRRTTASTHTRQVLRGAVRGEWRRMIIVRRQM